ncbi:tripartite ATP-independent transporter solute receptor, DctP family [Anaerovirgula multivorans]|uniref:Tripartite ATP-independent transporter solute receptor, DctP family n=1 Tax=Anaerovirgula multivorans TaxID=312168 RepID=A0A239JN57_9FIRM|nr:DctP family TRAP transporter solute-binding subunit [Anaerovirgula multivorans]SNT07245.1 tripartite ATP-independent transporter solute receptor, DctP family [Anaerovirgula multivorans]
MRKHYLKKIVVGLLTIAMMLSLVGCGGSSGSDEKPITIRMSHTQAPNSVSDLSAKEFARLVSEKSEGKIKVDVYSNSGLSGGDLTKAIEMVQTGDIDIHSAAPANIANFDAKFYVFWLPYLFPTIEDLVNATKDEAITTEVNSWLSEMDMTMLGLNNAGARQITNSKKEIKSVEDLKGMNIRVPGANLFIDLYKNYFGANPTAMDFSEVYTALQQGIIDGQENPISVFSSSKLNEVQNYVTLWDGVRDTTIWVMNNKRLEGFTAEEQAIIKESAAEAMEWGNAYLAENEEKIIEELEASGTVFTRLTDTEIQEFKDASAPIYDQYASQIGQDVIDLFRNVSK